MKQASVSRSRLPVIGQTLRWAIPIPNPSTKPTLGERRSGGMAPMGLSGTHEGGGVTTG